MEGMFILTNKLRVYGSKLKEKMSPEWPKHFLKLGDLLPHKNLCCPGVAECAWESEGVHISAVWCTVPSVCMKYIVIFKTPEHEQNP